MATALLPTNDGEAPALAIDAITGLPWRGEHQITLAHLLESAKGSAQPMDRRFLTRDDADLAGWSIPPASSEIELRPMAVRHVDGRYVVRPLLVCSAAGVDGLDPFVPMTTPTLAELGGKEVDAPLMEASDWLPGGVLREGLETALHGAAEPVATAGIAIWLLHGFLSQPIDDEVHDVVAAARAELTSHFHGGANLCAVANRGQMMADSLLDDLVRSKTGNRLWRRDLENRMAMEHGAPFPDLHRAEGVGWRMRSLVDSATDPGRDFIEGPSVLATIVKGAMAGDRRMAAALDTALMRCHAENPVEMTAKLTVDWGVATYRSEEEIRLRDEALAQGREPPLPRPLLEDIGALAPNAGEVSIESIHECGAGVLLMAMNAIRTEVTRTMLLLDSPLGEGGSVTCGGVDWHPIRGSRGFLWNDPSLTLSKRINEEGGTNLSFRLIREYGHVPPTAARKWADCLSKWTGMLIPMKDGWPADEALDAGFSAYEAQCAPNCQLFLLAEGQVPVLAGLAFSNVDSRASLPITIDGVTAEWRRSDLDGRMFVSPGQTAIKSMKKLRFKLKAELMGRQVDSIVNLSLYEPDDD